MSASTTAKAARTQAASALERFEAGELPPPGAPLLDVRHVSHWFGDQPALDNITFSIARGEVVGLIGRSGAGKSTLLRCLCALEKPAAGEITLNSVDITALPESKLVGVRRRIGLVFQHFNLLSARTAAANIALPLQIAGWSRTRIKDRVGQLLELVGMDGLGGKYPAQLSGGQKQRIGIARALAAGPDLLLSDEATSALDPEATASILQLLGNINRELGLTIVLITHEMDVVKRFAERILVLDKGRLVVDGTLAQFIRKGSDNPALTPLLAEIQPQLPEALRRRLAEGPGPGRLPVLRLFQAGPAATQPVMAMLEQRFNVAASLLQGGVSAIGDEPACDMIISLSGERAAEATVWLEGQTQCCDVVGWLCPL
ncbi:ATP-binding cassette domain-containing protein [Formicincola oecophyllae]|uniref:Cell division ATP-binding protein FtsE n=1 Tax=Formicincola oecophyllae TaxID=2558361 RepID=A0A4Y6U8N1_9PROT|nr:ATP-binding cassette domain-containing protein [Formicincola oecophyllae]QDH13350.1 ATP-binding cassette domain-containing protein [Formicincola oecophyllae]